MNRINKASLGTRYLINYINSKNVAHLDVVKNCTKDIAFWALLMHFCNNMSDLFDDLPESILENIFKGKSVEKVVDILDNKNTQRYEYGKGYKSNIESDYKTQLRLIRNALAHKKFEFDGEQIYVYNPNSEFKATFDYEWFKSLVLSTLSNSNYLVKKGLVDYAIYKLIKEEKYQAKDILSLEQEGLIKLIKLTCTASDTASVVRKFPSLSHIQDRITFDQLKISFIRSLSSLSKKEGFNVALEKLKRVYKGIFDVEVLNIKSPSLSENDFLSLPLKDGTDYLVNEKSGEDKNTRSTIHLKIILELLESLDKETPISASLDYSLEDTQEFLLNLYGYIYFAQNNYNNEKNNKIFDSFKDKIIFKIVHAQNVWNEYIKKISKALDVLKKSCASPTRIEMWEQRLNIYRLRLERIINDSKDLNIANNIRNSLTHGLVEHQDDLIIFYGEEPSLTLPKLNSKTKELTEYTFQNKGRTFEINIDKDTYLSLLDSLYEASGIEIKVNIAKYRKRKGYLES